MQSAFGYAGQKCSSFNVSSVLQSRIITLDALELVKVLDQHEDADSESVAEALAKEVSGQRAWNRNSPLVDEWINSTAGGG